MLTSRMKGVAMFNPRETYSAAGQRARHAERTGVRLMFSVIGFSTAYFLDPEHGAARRHQALEYLRRGKQMIGSARAFDKKATRTGTASPASEPPANGANGAHGPTGGDGLRIAR
jgi:hypothetical protein